MQEAIVGAVVAIPVVLYVLLRYKASLVFLAFCLSSLILEHANAPALAKSLAPFTGKLQPEYIQYALLFALPLVALALTVRKGKMGVKAIPTLLVAAGIGVIAAQSLVPLLPGVLSLKAQSGEVWHALDQYRLAILATAGFIAILQLVPGHTAEPSEKHK